MADITIPRKVCIVVVVTLLSCICACALSMPLKANAAELNAATLTTQGTATNTTRNNAQVLTVGQSVEGMFDYAEGTTNIENYFFKFKTSNRRSVYKMKIESLSGRRVLVFFTNDDGNGVRNRWDGKRATASATTCTMSDGDKDAWYYFEVSDDSYDVNHNYAGDSFMYGVENSKRYDQFRITVTEHPVINRVTGLKAGKKSKSSITIKWDKQANASKYQVKWRKKGGSWKTFTTTSANKKIAKLKKNTKYQFKVRAYCNSGYDIASGKTANWSKWSDVKTVKTKK